MLQKTRSAYHARFGTWPEMVVFAPGRINLIGEHTDYNHGFVLPAAVQYGIWFAFGLRNDATHVWYAADTDEQVSIASMTPRAEEGWSGYFSGACRTAHAATGEWPAVNCVFCSDLPIGAGLSSSSALTCGFLLGLEALYQFGWSAQEIALRAHHVEREEIGLQGGIMDQFACMLSASSHFLLIDCLDRSTQLIPYTAGQTDLFLLNTNVRHKLTETDYNTRAAECREAFTILSETLGIRSFRDLENHEGPFPGLSTLLQQRVSFVMQENARVMAAIQALRENDMQALGKLLIAGHVGLRDAYEVSCPELDALVDFALESGHVLGARMMGGGFGGCTINLSAAPPEEAFLAETDRKYAERFGMKPTFIPVRIGDGARVFA